MSKISPLFFFEEKTMATHRFCPAHARAGKCMQTLLFCSQNTNKQMQKNPKTFFKSILTLYTLKKNYYFHNIFEIFTKEVHEEI